MNTTTTAFYDQCFDRLMGHEGAYSSHPDDPGGETMWGVTKAVARAFGYAGPMQSLPRDFARGVYHAQYWMMLRCDAMPKPIAWQVFDAGVNSGTGQASKWLQQAVGANPDGAIGPKTLDAIARLPLPVVVLRFNAARLQFYTGLTTWPTFGRGWARRIAGNLTLAAEDVR